jgi:hypothetical protein
MYATQKDLGSVEDEYAKQIVQTQIDLGFIQSPMASTGGICSGVIKSQPLSIILIRAGARSFQV